VDAPLDPLPILVGSSGPNKNYLLAKFSGMKRKVKKTKKQKTKLLRK